MCKSIYIFYIHKVKCLKIAEYLENPVLISQKTIAENINYMKYRKNTEI